MKYSDSDEKKKPGKLTEDDVVCMFGMSVPWIMCWKRWDANYLLVEATLHRPN